MSARGALLIVADEPARRETLARQLAQGGHEVTVASAGEAIERIPGGGFDLALLDTTADGAFEFLAHVRTIRSRSDLPVLLAQAGEACPRVAEGLRLGASDCVTLPIDVIGLTRIDTHLAHKRTADSLQDSQERYTLTTQAASDGLCDWNLLTNQVRWSPRWYALFGYQDGELAPHPDEWFSRVHHEDVADLRAALAAHLAKGDGLYECEHRILHRSGSYRWVRCRGAIVRDPAGRATRLAGSLTDITETKLADALTGLPNRVIFGDLLDRAIKRAQRRRGYRFALLALGLNRFATVNDSLGFQNADRLLAAVARRLQASLRPTDVIMGTHECTLARLGGDEFTVLLDDIADVGDGMKVAERLRTALQQPFDLDGRQVFMSASIGIAVSTAGYERADDIIRDAAIALHRAKADGNARCELFDAAMRQYAITRLEVETDLRRAIENREFEVYYQPIVSLTTGEIAGFEALARWRHASRGLVGPTEFIPIAEDTGMILQIGRLVLDESCRQLAEWQRRFGAAAPRVVCVNVSSRQFADGDLAAYIESMLERTGLPSCSLKLEITESAFLGDLLAAQLTLTRVRALGVECSLDDFGTGYSSLSYLQNLQVNTVKVDRSFVSHIGGSDNGAEMVRAIVGLAHTLGMDVVAEGVETPDQMAQLRTFGCEFAQGFYFSPPVDGAAAAALVAARPWVGLPAQLADPGDLGTCPAGPLVSELA